MIALISVKAQFEFLILFNEDRIEDTERSILVVHSGMFEKSLICYLIIYKYFKLSPENKTKASTSKNPSTRSKSSTSAKVPKKKLVKQWAVNDKKARDKSDSEDEFSENDSEGDSEEISDEQEEDDGKEDEEMNQQDPPSPQNSLSTQDTDDGKEPDVKDEKEPVHFEESSYKTIDFDATDFKNTVEVPIDFHYKRVLMPDKEYELRMVPLKSDVSKQAKPNEKFQSKVVYIQINNSMDRMQFLANISKRYHSEIKFAKASDIRDEMIRNPDNFVLAKLPASDLKKISSKLETYDGVVNRTKFKFLEIVRKKPTVENQTQFTGNFPSFLEMIEILVIFR